jgi:hypothetical protein
MKTRIWSLFLILSLSFGTQVIRAEDNAEQVTLKGYFIKRADNTYLHIEMVGVRMIIKLLDENHQEIENVFTRGVMTVNAKGKSRERMVIRPVGDGIKLQSSKTIRKPHLLKVNGRLYQGEDTTTGEPFNLQYNQHTVEEVTVAPKPKE